MYFRLYNSCSRSAVRFWKNVDAVVKTSRRGLYYDQDALQNPPRKIASEKFSGYNVIYQLHTIRYIAAFNKFKYHYTFLTAAAVSVTSCLWSLNLVSQTIYVPMMIFTCVLTIMLYCTGLLCNNVVGFIYLDNDKKRIKLSYLNFWGKREDVDLELNDITPLSETNTGYRIYRSLKLSTIKKPLKLYIKNAEILDEEDFSNIFGSVKV